MNAAYIRAIFVYFMNIYKSTLLMKNTNKKSRSHCLSKGLIERAKTHSRQISKLCVDPILPQSQVSRQILGGKSKTMTIKIGMNAILKTLRNGEKQQFMAGLAKVVGFNRRVMICGHLFMLFYFTQRLATGGAIPMEFLDYRFVNGVYQLVIGRQWSNKGLYDNQTRGHINAAFDQFKHQYPNAICPLVESTIQGKSVIGFVKILTSISKSYIANVINHIVEGFDPIYVSYLQARLSRLLPTLTTSQVAQLACFIHDATSNNDSHPPIWPTIIYNSSLDDTEVNNLDNDLNECSGVTDGRNI